MTERAIIGCILGTAVGDSLGLPYEGISPHRRAKLFGPPDRHHFLFGHGMVSDDTEHTLLVVQALIKAKGNPRQFEHLLARSLRWWLTGLPAGVGLATLRSILRLWRGVPPDRSGVYSAGNGPAMRSPLLGVVFGDQPEVLKEFVLRSTRMTHSDPKAFFGALTVALAAYLSSQSHDASPHDFSELICRRLPQNETAELIGLIKQASASASKGETVCGFAESIGCRHGVSGYIYHTVCCVIQTWLRYPGDFAGGMQEILSAGGDTDTTGAILGGIIGARVGKEGIPIEWRSGIAEWPRTIRWMEQLGGCLANAVQDGRDIEFPNVFPPAILLRNLFFLVVVLFHAFRRLAPPY